MSNKVPQEPIPALPKEPEPPVPSGARVVASPQTSVLQTAASGPPNGDAPKVRRSGITITAWDLELLLRPATHGLAVRGRVTVRNDGAPLTTLPLEISSSLDWQSVSAQGKPLAFTRATVDTGFDHTAAAHEAEIALPAPLAAGASIAIDVLYEGAVPLNATRIEQLGAPPDIAEHTDWDRIDGDFTGVRGVGNVLWYPVAAEPVMLGDGAKLFTATGEWKLRHEASTMRVRLRVDTSADVDAAEHAAMVENGPPSVVTRSAPQMAILNGVRVPLVADALSGSETLLTGELPATPLGFAAASFFLTGAPVVSGDGLRIFAAPGDAAAAPAFPTAMTLVRAAVEQWLPRQQRDIAVVSLPRDADAPFLTAAWWSIANGGPLLATPMPPRAPDQLTPQMVDTLAHASFLSPRPWLSEGVPEFMASIWAGHGAEGAAGTNASLELLEAGRSALALAEPGDGSTDTGQPLLSAYDDVYLRVKSAYVLWMLRGMVGDGALISALKAYRAGDDKVPEYFERLVEASSHKDLAWFFADWVYADRGLPELRIANVITNKMDTAGGSWLVSVDVANDGYAGVEVPVRVDAGDRHETVRVHVSARGNATAHVVLHAQPARVTVNDGSTPETTASVHVRDL